MKIRLAFFVLSRKTHGDATYHFVACIFSSKMYSLSLDFFLHLHLMHAAEWRWSRFLSPPTSSGTGASTEASESCSRSSHNHTSQLPIHLLQAPWYVNCTPHHPSTVFSNHSLTVQKHQAANMPETSITPPAPIASRPSKPVSEALLNEKVCNVHTAARRRFG